MEPQAEGEGGEQGENERRDQQEERGAVGLEHRQCGGERGGRGCEQRQNGGEAAPPGRRRRRTQRRGTWRAAALVFLPDGICGDTGRIGGHEGRRRSDEADRPPADRSSFAASDC
ncbi:hypothetical protein [Kaistia hirudinis]|uniref:hypothetical protein n=1 Tax=Kaistia hirudinis TaxID=1293440 RepID=UPI0035E618C0